MTDWDVCLRVLRSAKSWRKVTCAGEAGGGNMGERLFFFGSSVQDSNSSVNFPNKHLTKRADICVSIEAPVCEPSHVAGSSSDSET